MHPSLSDVDMQRLPLTRPPAFPAHLVRRPALLPRDCSKAIIDWLMTKDEGKRGLSLLNREGFTPLTLAARVGNVDAFQHILRRHMSQTAWTYGKVRPAQDVPMRPAKDAAR